MRYKKPLANILNDLISSLTFPVTIFKATQNGADWILNVDDAYYSQKGFTISIGGNNYIIQSVQAQSTYDILTVTGTPTISVNTFNMYPIYFFYGTLVDGGIQLSQIANATQKTPLIFLPVDDSLVETYHNDPVTSHERSSRCKLYFLSQGDDSLLNPDALSLNVEPMKRLFEIFNDATKDAISIFDYYNQDFDLKLYAKFGVYSGGKQPSKLWADDLSGCGVDIKFDILKTQYE